MKRGTSLRLLIISLISCIFSLLLLYNNKVEDIVISIIFVINYILSISIVWTINNKKINLFVLFFLTFGLFIGGGFLACLLDHDLDPFQPLNFYSYTVDYKSKIEIVTYVLLFMYMTTCGYFASYQYKREPKFLPFQSASSIAINKFLRILQIPLALIVVVFSVKFVWEGLQSGYLEHFVAGQSDEYSGSTLDNLIKQWISIFLGLAIAFGEKRTKVAYLILFSVLSLANLYVGSRSNFGVLLLILLWLYSEHHKVSLKKLGLGLVLAMFLMIFLFSFSVREANISRAKIPIFDAIAFFIQMQGSSLMVFDASKSIESYPLLPYFQSFIPGSSFFYSLISGESLNPWDVTFSKYMCYNLNPQLYFEGYGLGWSILSDLYLFSGRMLPFFVFLSFIWGYFVGKLEIWSSMARFYRFISVTLSTTLLLLPRGGFNSFFPLLIYSIVTWIFINILFSYLRDTPKSMKAVKNNPFV